MTTPQLIFRFTFGTYNQGEPWTDVRSLTWPNIAELLTSHDFGPKEGTCVVPATFRGIRRRKSDADRIDVAFLDSDSGATLEEIREAVSRHGWSAIISSTHSHQTTTTVAKRTGWDHFRNSKVKTTDHATAFLIQEKGYLPRIAMEARILRDDGEFVRLGHQPCPKFRVVIPLLRPWLAADYQDQNNANADWKCRIEALATALNLSHDQACTDTSRLFFLPRRAADSPMPEIDVIDGRPCDLFALPAPSSTKKGRSRPQQSDDLLFTDPETGEVQDLRKWVGETAGQLQLVAALKARRPDLFTGKVTDRTKHHIRCVNEDSHTNAGTDTATFIMNADDTTNQGFVYHCRHAHCEGKDRLFFLRRMLELRWLNAADLLNLEFRVQAVPPRKLIRYIAGKLPEIVDQAEQALLESDLDLYRRGTALVRPGSIPVTAGQARSLGAQQILEVEEHALIEAMTLAADWERYDGRSGQWVQIDAPLKVATTYRQRVGHWKLPVLTGLISAPTLRPDSSLLCSDGYDVTTGLLLDTRGITFPTVPDRPTKLDARRAIADLKNLIASFPFVDEPSRAVALSAILTGSIRSSLRTAPLHAFTAPVAGSGKSMLVDLVSLIGNGRTAGVIAQGKTEEELEKRLGALLLAGEAVIAIDNCEAPLGGEFLCSILTQVSVRARILGRSEMPELPTNALVTATGNNLILLGDITRRSLLCRLDPKDERPELRQFPNNPINLVRSKRSGYLSAALTVLRAYHVADRPDPPQALGSFDDWSSWVRGALIWLDCGDPVATIAEVRRSDPRLNALAAVISQWEAAIGYNTVSVRELVEKASQGPLRPGHIGQQSAWPDLREALLVVAGDGGAINNRRLGKWLLAQQDRIVEGRKLVRHGIIAGTLQWRLQEAVTPEARPAA